MIKQSLEKALAAALSALIALPLHLAPVWVAAAETAAPAAKPAAPAAKSAATAATLDAIDVGDDSVRVRLSAESKHSSFVTAKPPRLIVQFEGVQLATSAKQQAGKGKHLKAVRAGQFQKDPLIARVVLDLVEMTAFKIDKTGADVVISLGGGAAPAQSASASAASPAVEGAVAPEVKPVVAAKPARPKVSAPKPVAAAKPAPKPAEEPMGTAEPDDDDDDKEAAAARSQMNRKVGETGDMTTRNSADLDALAKSKEATATPSDVAALPPTTNMAAVDRPRMAKGDIMARLSRDLVTLDFDNTDIKDVLRLLAAKAKVNIIYGSDVSGSISLHLTDVPFADAFRTILTMQGLATTQVGDNILRVLTPAALARAQTTAASVTKVIPLNYAKATELVAAVNTVRGAEGRQGSTLADQKTNALIVTESVEGMVATEKLVASLDARPKQVLIEAKLVEVGLTNSMHYGIQWDYFSVDRARMGGQIGTNLVGTLTSDRASGSPTGTPIDLNGQTAVGDGGAQRRGTGVFLPATNAVGALTLGRITNNYFLSATLTAAAAQGKVKVLSDPKVATLNNQPANINVITRIPYVTNTVTATGLSQQNVSYIDTGIQLMVTPSINADGRITLEVNPKVSQAVASTASNLPPPVDSRDAKTTVMVRDGETIVIGGLISDSVSNQIAKIPILGDIPILGWLFKKKSTVRTRAELLIFVTTRILPD